MISVKEAVIVEVLGQPTKSLVVAKAVIIRQLIQSVRHLDRVTIGLGVTKFYLVLFFKLVGYGHVIVCRGLLALFLTALRELLIRLRVCVCGSQTNLLSLSYIVSQVGGLLVILNLLFQCVVGLYILLVIILLLFLLFLPLCLLPFFLLKFFLLTLLPLFFLPKLFIIIFSFILLCVTVSLRSVYEN